MARIKSAVRVTLFSLPPLCLLAYALGLGLPLPRFLFPETAVSAEGRPADIALAEAGALGPGAYRVVMDGHPSAAQLSLAQRVHADSGASVAFEVSGRESSPLAAWSLGFDALSATLPLTVLVTEEAAASERIELSVDGRLVYAWDGENGTALGPDRKIRAVLDASDDGSAQVELRVRSGDQESTAAFRVPTGGSLEPRVLLVGPEGAGRSVVEALFPARRVGLDEFSSSDPYRYELIVLDGARLADLGSERARVLAGLAERGAASVMLVADSPDFGSAGQAPELERVLPVDLAPRSLKHLPDLAMLVLIDASGSMFGDKLSLAKVTGIETLGNLKPADLVGMLAFSDSSRWLYRFEPAGTVQPAAELEPLAAGGGTRLHPALKEGLEALAAADRPQRHAVIISDGVTKPGDFGSLAAFARGAGITISVMAVGDDYERSVLAALADGTGGRLYRVLDVDQIPSLMLEDRLAAARTVFSEQRDAVYGINGRQLGFVDGMARFTPRDGALVPLATAAGDPLLASRTLAGCGVLVFASDIRGRWTRDLFGNAEALGAFRAVLAGLMSGREQGASIMESADGLHIVVRGDYLAAPSVILADEAGNVAAEADFERSSSSHWSATVSPAAGRRYTALVMDRGTVAARFPLWANRAAAAPSDGAARALASYRTPGFVVLQGGRAWLVAFFALSLAATAVLRFRR